MFRAQIAEPAAAIKHNFARLLDLYNTENEELDTFAVWWAAQRIENDARTIRVLAESDMFSRLQRLERERTARLGGEANV